MAYGTPADPVGGTVITVAYATSNLLDPIRWLRLLTGNADPPGSSYVVVSDSTTGTTWRKIPTDAIADAAITDVKLATPKVSKAGDTMSGLLTISTGGLDATGGIILRTAGMEIMLGGLTIDAGGLHIVTGGLAVDAGGMTIGTTTMVANLNADMLHGQTLANLDSRYDSFYANIGGDTFTGAVTIHAGGLTIDAGGLVVSTGGLNIAAGGLAVHGAMTIDNNAQVANLNASLLGGLATGGSAGNIPVYDGSGRVVAAITADNALAIADGAVSTTAKLANLIVTAAKIANATITDTQVASANKDGVAGTASMRTLGTGSAQAAAGNHTHTAMAKIATGTYAGNSGTRAVSGLGFAPSHIDVVDTAGGNGGFIQNGISIQVVAGGATASGTATMDADGFTLSGVTLNVTGHTYGYAAYG